MPIFEFKCNNCEKVFEELLKDTSLSNQITCPYCKNQNITKLVSRFAISDGKMETLVSNKSKCSGCPATSCSTCSL